MRRSHITAAVLGALAIATAAITSAPATPAHRVTKLVFVGHQTDLRASPDFPSPASSFVEVHADDIAGKGPAHDRSACMVISTNGIIQCNTTITLSGGTLEFAYQSGFTQPTVHLALVGGTGRYSGARGYAVVNASGPSTIAGWIVLA